MDRGASSGGGTRGAPQVGSGQEGAGGAAEVPGAGARWRAGPGKVLRGAQAGAVFEGSF